MGDVPKFMAEISRERSTPSIVVDGESAKVESYFQSRCIGTLRTIMAVASTSEF